MVAPILLLAITVVSCADSARFGQGEPCFFVFEEDSMSSPAFCAIEMTSRDPCAAIAECLCAAWMPSATDDELLTCIDDELQTSCVEGDQARISLFCNEETDLSIEEVVKSFATIRDARLSIAGPCDAMPTHHTDVALVE